MSKHHFDFPHFFNCYQIKGGIVMDNSKLWTSAKFFERLDFFLSEKNWMLYQLCSDVDITVDAIYKM